MELKLSYKRIIILILEWIITLFLAYQLYDIISINLHDNLDLNIRIAIAMLLFTRYFFIINIADNKISDKLHKILNIVFYVGTVLIGIPTSIMLNYIGLGLYGVIILLSLFLHHKGFIYLLDRFYVYKNNTLPVTVAIMSYTVFLVLIILSMVARESTIQYLIFIIVLISVVGYGVLKFLENKQVKKTCQYYLIATTVFTALFFILQKVFDFNILYCSIAILALAAVPVLFMKQTLLVNTKEYASKEIPVVSLF